MYKACPLFKLVLFVVVVVTKGDCGHEIRKSAPWIYIGCAQLELVPMNFFSNNAKAKYCSLLGRHFTDLMLQTITRTHTHTH